MVGSEEFRISATDSFNDDQSVSKEQIIDFRVLGITLSLILLILYDLALGKVGFDSFFVRSFDWAASSTVLLDVHNLHGLLLF